MSTAKPTLLWFRKDLRLADNPALARAIEAGGPVIPVFIWAPGEAGAWPPGGASQWWLHEALKRFAAQWKSLGGTLVLQQGESLATLRELVRKTGAGRVYWNRRYEEPLRTLDGTIKEALRADGIESESFNASLLNEPHTVRTGNGNPYKVYTPYWKNVSTREPEAPVEVDLEAIRFPKRFPRSVPLASLNLLPKVPWHRGFPTHWEPGEAAALQRLEAFLDGPVEDYHRERDRPDHEGTSSLSPYLHWGHLGPRQIARELRLKYDLRRDGPLTFLKEIYWREFAYHVLYHFPETPTQPLRSEYAAFPWRPDPAGLEAWKAGRTGYPIVDAGMRQLWQTGWMHNRVRMIVSSLLVKHLLQNWRHGAEWFWDTLVDADLASNTLGWQWSGGCGADAAPFFRVFNPIIQGKKFDPRGDYVRLYLPELQKLDIAYLHEPWQAPPAALRAAGITLGSTYPEPIIEHKAGRERALAAFSKFRS